MKPTKVKVTAEHIKKGLKEDPCNCPIALALKDAGYKEVLVRGSEIEFDSTNGYAICIAAGTRIDLFIDDFDSGTKVKPMTISMPIPPNYIPIEEMEVN